MGLVVEGLTKAFGPVQALQGVSLRVPKGCLVGLVGPNGAGKTTTLRILARILQPDAGRVEWDGRPLDRLPRSLVGYLPEERGLYPSMRVDELLAFFGRLRGLSGQALRGAVDGVVELLELGPLLDRRVGWLSKGNAQRVQLAAVCLHRPSLLLLDEPFSGLDVAQVRRLSAVLEELRRLGTAVLFSSHHMEHVERLCDSVVIVAGGRVALAGSLQEVRQSAAERVVRLAWEDTPAGGPASGDPCPSPGERGPSADEPGLRPGHGQAAHGGTLSGTMRVWLEGMRSQGARVVALPDGRWELRWPAAALPDPQRLLEEARRLGPLRLFEVTYPSLEEVYLAAVARPGGVADGLAGHPGEPPKVAKPA